MDSRKNTSQIPQKNSDRRKKHYQYKKAQLPQKDHVTLYVSKFVLCFTSYESYKGFKLQKGSLRSPKGAGKLAMCHSTYHIRFPISLPLQLCLSFIIFEVSSLISQNSKRLCDSEHIHFGINISCIHSYSSV